MTYLKRSATVCLHVRIQMGSFMDLPSLVGSGIGILIFYNVGGHLDLECDGFFVICVLFSDRLYCSFDFPGLESVTVREGIDQQVGELARQFPFPFAHPH